MKKIFYLLSIFTLLLFVSCMEDKDNWYSETSEYAGRFVFNLMSEDMQDTYMNYDGSEIQIYNTVENMVNKIWLEDHGDVFPIKNIFTLSGDFSAFKSESEDFANLNYNILSVEDLPTSAPTATGQTVDEDREYVKAAILEGKILPGAATSIGGNVTDSIYIKIKLYSGTATYESYEIAESGELTRSRVIAASSRRSAMTWRRRGLAWDDSGTTR